MPRSPRVDYAGAWHHVMNRGADHRSIFGSDADRSVFLDSLAAAAERCHLEVHTYCLMSNHFHVLVRSCTGQLSEGMKFLSGRFTRVTNVRAGRDGSLFRGRYYSVGVSSDAHLVQACRYIHLNPVVARIVRRAEAWRWSSAAAYAGCGAAPEWLRKQYIVDLFGPTNAEGNYRDFMAEGVDVTTTRFYADLGW
jgi:putative transposase